MRPEGCEIDFPIKKANIAINAADTRTSRFTGGERIDCAIADLDFEKKGDFKCQTFRGNREERSVRKIWS